MFITLKTSSRGETLERLLQHLDLHVVAHASSAAPPPTTDANIGNSGNNTPTKAILDSRTVSAADAPVISQETTDDNVTSVIWRVELHLRHLDQQLSRPIVYFTASATLRNDASDVASNSSDQYLTSGSPLPENLLRSLHDSPAFADTDIRLPASRIQKVTPRSSAMSTDVRPLRASSKQFAVVSALTIKRQALRIADSSLVSLDLEVAQRMKCDFHLEDVRGRVHDTTLESISPKPFARTMKPGDRTNFVFRLPTRSNDQTHDLSTDAAAIAQMVITGHALLSDSCRPRLRIHMDINAQSLSVRDTQSPVRYWQRQSSQVSSRPTSVAAPDQGLTFTFNGPLRVNEGETLYIDVFVVNRSIKKRFMALVAIPRSYKSNPLRQRQPANHEVDPNSKVSAVVDDRTVTKLQNGNRTFYASFVALSADVKIGPLVPGACHNTQLEFLVLSPGRVTFETLNVVDIETRETVCIADLPEILAYEKASSA